MKIFYCAFESIFDPVLESQVIVPLKKINYILNQENTQAKLILFGSIGDVLNKKYWTKRELISTQIGGNVFFSIKFPYFYKYRLLFKLSLFLNSIACFIIVCLKLRLKRNEIALFHCRTEMASYILLNIKNHFYPNFRIICDCRGIGSKEILYKIKSGNKPAITARVNNIEKYAHVKSDYIFCVSNAFKEYIMNLNDYQVNKISVIPCCINTDIFHYSPQTRKKIRSKLQINEESFIVTYSGSFNGWQLPKRMAEIFLAIKNLIEESIFLVFTKDIAVALEFFSNSGIPPGEYIVKHVDYAYLNEYLLAGDLGLIIRENNDVNNVAFPLKFAEYIRCGVPVLSSISSDVMDMIKELGLGFILKDFQDDNEVKGIAEQIRRGINRIKSDSFKQEISDSIKKRVDWEVYIPEIVKIYKELLQ